MRLLALILALAAPLPAASTLQVICYHRFAQDCGKDPYCVGLAELGAQLDWLKSEGWQSVGLTQVAKAMDGGEALPPKAVMLSVDDGYKAGALGAAAFEARGFKGVFFINPGSLAKGKRAKQSRFMAAEDLRQLEQRGHDIGSHGLTHANLGKVPAGLAPGPYQAWLEGELAGSRQDLEALLGHAVSDLAWPYGAYNNAVVAAAKAAGYRQLYTVAEAVAQVPGDPRDRIPRFLLAGRVPLASFKRRVGQGRVCSGYAGRLDGDIAYASELATAFDPSAKAGSALLDGKRWSPGDGASLGRGFHFITDQPSDGPACRLLFQVAPDAWRPHFSLLTQQP